MGGHSPSQHFWLCCSSEFCEYLSELAEAHCLSHSHFPLQCVTVTVSKPDTDATGEQIFDGTPVEYGVDWRREPVCLTLSGELPPACGSLLH